MAFRLKFTSQWLKERLPKEDAGLSEGMHPKIVTAAVINLYPVSPKLRRAAW